MNEKMLVDSCLLVYFIDPREKEKHEKTVGWFKERLPAENLFVSNQNLREFASVAIKKSTATTNEITDALQLFSETFKIIQDNAQDIARATALCEGKKKIFWDALIVATMQRNGIQKIITENTKHFEKFNAIKAINPLE